MSDDQALFRPLKSFLDLWRLYIPRIDFRSTHHPNFSFTALVLIQFLYISAALKNPSNDANTKSIFEMVQGV